jgi:PASTA domain
MSSKSRGPWQDGRRAWERLSGWHEDGPAAGHPDDGERALEALGDVGLVRRLLDQAELVSVRTARRHGKSWAEIAIRLGVTRQSAWERWRDLDDAAPAAGPGSPGDPQQIQPGPEVVADIESVVAGAAAELTGKAAGERRRRSNVKVPGVIGMSWDNARHALLDRSLVAVGPDQDGPPLAATGWPDGVVTDQSPEAGARVPAGSPVTLWIGRRGGGAGVREPRRPSPDPRTGREVQPEPTGEAVG